MKKRVSLVLACLGCAVGVLSFFAYAHRAENGGSGSGFNASLSTPIAAVRAAAEAGLGAPPAYDLSANQTLSRVIYMIKENYVDPTRINAYDMFMAALDSIQKTVPEVIVDSREAPEQIKVVVGEAEHLSQVRELNHPWEVVMALREIFQFLQTRIEASEARRDIEYAAINGILSTLDPHSVLLRPESFDEVKLTTKGEFGGLGIVISIRDGALTIISPIGGTPAAKAGLKARDKIMKIGEESTVNMTLEEAVGRLRGKPGTEVTIGVLRKNWTEPRRFQLTRAIIKIESVTSKLLADGVGYLRIKSFQNNTFADLQSHLDRMRKEHKGQLKGLVLDLRNNPGGLLDQAILISDRFIERGALVITVSEGNRKRDVKSAHFSDTEKDYPMVVLVNGGSASASEIVSGAIKNHDRGLVLGQQTFGKGSVQVLYDLVDRSALKLTIAQYLTPGDVSIQSVGITPDVELVPATVSKERVHLLAENAGMREKDLDKHLETYGKKGQAATKGSHASSSSSKPLMSTAASGPGVSKVRIVHLLEEDPDDDSSSGIPDSAQNEFVEDFEIRLAHDVLVAAAGKGRAAMKRPGLLAAASGLFAKHVGEQQKHIADRLGALGVDWSDGPATGTAGGTPRAEVSFRLERVGSAGKDATSAQSKAAVGGAPPVLAAVPAGETVRLVADVRNSGNAPLYRAFGITKSDAPLLDKLEFVFGKVPAGGSRSWSLDVKIPQEAVSRAEHVALEMDDLHHASVGVQAAAMLEVASLPRPRFAYQVWVDDREGGNGDGLLQVGERVSLRVGVENVGAGVAEAGMVTVKNTTGKALFLDRGREALGVLVPGAREVAHLVFELREKVPEVKLRLSVWDSNLGASATEVLVWPVGPVENGAMDAAVLSPVGNRGVPVYAGASEATGSVGELAAGARLVSDALFGGVWRRVLVGGRFGFVRDTQVKKVAAGSAAAAARTQAKEATRLAAALDSHRKSVRESEAKLVAQADKIRRRAAVGAPDDGKGADDGRDGGVAGVSAASDPALGAGGVAVSSSKARRAEARKRREARLARYEKHSEAATKLQQQLASVIPVQRDRGQSAPVIRLEQPALQSGRSPMRLKGVVEDEQGLVDMFVFVNDKKIYYRALADQKPKDGKVRAPFDISVPLEAGSNAVMIVARESDELVSRKVLGVYHHGTAAAVAERRSSVTERRSSVTK